MENPFMRAALNAAGEAAASGEVPVGAVVVRGKTVVAAGRNCRETERTALGHAEMAAIHAACKTLGRWRLDDCDLYVTLEPCPMCAGAAVNARLRRVYFGAYDSRAGAFGSVTDFSCLPFDRVPEIYGGVMEAECGRLLAEFFDSARGRARVRAGESEKSRDFGG